MKKINRLLGFAMSIVMMGSQALPVLAEEPTPTPLPVIGAEDANILDNNVTDVIVPTAIRLAVNPNGYSVVKRYVKASANGGAFDADTTYYKLKNDNTYEKVAEANVDEDEFGDYYVPDEDMITTDQIVTLNYGIASKATDPVAISVNFIADYSGTAGKTAIDFVDTTEKAVKKSESNPDGAARGELKMFLALASASYEAEITANTMNKTKDTAMDVNGSVYYEFKNGDYEYVSPYVEADFKAGKYYEADTVIGDGAIAKHLADVSWNRANTAVNGGQSQVFLPEEGQYTTSKASISYNLAEGVYGLKTGEIIDFDTTQSQLKEKLELTTMGGVTGFTFVGAMNPDADWTSAMTTSIRITPIYEIGGITGAETPVEGTKNQITFNGGSTAYITATTISGTSNIVDVNLPDGVSLGSVVLNKADGSTLTLQTSKSQYSFSNGKLTISSSVLSAHVGETITVRFSDGESSTLTIN